MRLFRRKKEETTNCSWTSEAIGLSEAATDDAGLKQWSYAPRLGCG